MDTPFVLIIIREFQKVKKMKIVGKNIVNSKCLNSVLPIQFNISFSVYNGNVHLGNGGRGGGPWRGTKKGSHAIKSQRRAGKWRARQEQRYVCCHLNEDLLTWEFQWCDFPVATAKLDMGSEAEEGDVGSEAEEVDVSLEAKKVAPVAKRCQGPPGLETGCVRLLTVATKTSAGGLNAASARHQSLKVRLNFTRIFVIFFVTQLCFSCAEPGRDSGCRVGGIP